MTADLRREQNLRPTEAIRRRERTNCSHKSPRVIRFSRVNTTWIRRVGREWLMAATKCALLWPDTGLRSKPRQKWRHGLRRARAKGQIGTQDRQQKITARKMLKKLVDQVQYFSGAFDIVILHSECSEKSIFVLTFIHFFPCAAQLQFSHTYQCS